MFSRAFFVRSSHCPVSSPGHHPLRPLRCCSRSRAHKVQHVPVCGLWRVAYVFRSNCYNIAMNNVFNPQVHSTPGTSRASFHMRFSCDTSPPI